MYSCSLDDLDSFISNTRLPAIGLSNWTGHWDTICSPGETLIFSITAYYKAQTYEIPFDSGASFQEENLKEGDLIRITIMDKNRNVILSQNKNFYPSNPERTGGGLNRTPMIQVCDRGRLDLFNF